MQLLRQRLESYFEFERLQTNWRTEVVAGLTTFLTMAYIIFVNPSILGEAGMPVMAVTAATCIASATGSILMGAWARYPIALAPGMGLNAYFTYAVVKGLGVSWQVALGAVFLSGLAFFVLTAAGLRQLILAAFPAELYSAVAVGIGFFIALIGLRNAGIIQGHPATLVTLGDLSSPSTTVALGGLVLTSVLMAWRVRGAILLGVLTTAAAGVTAGIFSWKPQPVSLSALGGTALRLDIPGAMKVGLLEIVFVFLFVDLFDNLGTLVGVGTKAGLFQDARQIPRLERILFTDSVATICGSLTGTSTVVSYIESAAGVAAGGRSGVTAIVAGLMFLVALLVAPVAGGIPAAATAPALILIGSLMASHARDISWEEPLIAVPAFLTIITVPLSFSIANGLSFGFTAYTLLRLARGEFRQVNLLAYGLTLLFLIRFYYLGKA
ncbi:MAG: NCS2 family permease [Bryobacteraceae bacterium]|nr:NCS2 family permease [Bryobacteraceae bacterium]MDW8379518.1 NCS2 family permease [Bryobacterales bacterium]